MSLDEILDEIDSLKLDNEELRRENSNLRLQIEDRTEDIKLLSSKLDDIHKLMNYKPKGILSGTTLSSTFDDTSDNTFNRSSKYDYNLYNNDVDSRYIGGREESRFGIKLANVYSKKFGPYQSVSDIKSKLYTGSPTGFMGTGKVYSPSNYLSDVSDISDSDDSDDFVDDDNDDDEYGNYKRHGANTKSSLASASIVGNREEPRNNVRPQPFTDKVFVSSGVNNVKLDKNYTSDDESHSSSPSTSTTTRQFAGHELKQTTGRVFRGREQSNDRRGNDLPYIADID